MKIGARITAIAVVPIIATVAVVLAIALLQKGLLRDFFTGEIDRQAQSEAQKVVQSAYLLCRAAAETGQTQGNASLRRALMDLQVGRDGYVWVVGGQGSDYGRYIVSKQGQRDGEYLLDRSDEQGTLFMRRMIARAQALPAVRSDEPIPVVFDRYPWANPGESRARDKSVALTYFPPWGWVIGAAYYDSDFAPLQQRMNAALDRMAIWVGCAALLMALIALPLGWLVAEGIRIRVDSILTSVSDILIVTDNRDHVYLLSQTAEQLFDVPLAKVKGQPLAALISAPALLETVTTALRERQSGILFQFEWPDAQGGPPRTLQGRTALVQSAGGLPNGMIVTIHDISKEREIEQIKSELLSTTAHELNTPLTAIIGYSELLLDENLDTGTRHEASHYINQKAWALSRIVHELLDVSRIETGNGITLSCMPCEIGTLIDDVLHYARKLTNKHAFELKLPQEAVVLCLDRDKVEEVLENILSNAIKYSPHGGTIRIHARHTAESFELSISDEGIGMTAAQAARVFDKFYRADATNTAIHGTGLGMTIVKHIVDAHGGDIRIETAPGCGTTVHLTFPRTTHPT